MKYTKKIKTNKLLKILLFLTIISLIVGILFIAILDETNKTLIITNVTNFFNNILKNNLNYQKAFNTTLLNNLLVNVFVWLLGISIIGIPIVILILLIKGFILGFSFSSIIYTYHFKGIITGIIYIFSHLLSLFVIFIVTYYSISFSLLLYNYLFRKKDYNRILITKRYLKLLFFSSVTLIIVTILEVFLIPFIFQLL